MTIDTEIRQPGALPMEQDPRRSGVARRARSRPTAEQMQYAVGQSALGLVLVARSAAGVTAILFGDDADALRAELAGRFPEVELVDGAAEMEALTAAVVGFVEAPAGGLDAALDMRGTPFQRSVWQALREIPAGSTASYTTVAARIGAPSAVRAVARACAANSLGVVVPCHRVVRSDGGRAGYYWGVARKRALLDREAAR